MKILSRILPLIGISLFFNYSNAQSYQLESMTYDGQTRTYQIYVPNSYDGTTPFPLVFNFHGGNGDHTGHIAMADFSPIADTANFIVVYPQALEDPNDGNSTNWIHKSPTTVDDVYFVDSLIDLINSNYAIDLTRVYACGYSLGGEFTYELGCRLNNRIAAFSPVARTMQTFTYDNCAPVHPTGVLTILGTADQISLYDGVSWNGEEYYKSADDTHTLWANHNNCDSVPTTANVPNTNTSDGSTVERRSWSDQNGCVYVEELKVIGGGHDWPGAYGNMDIDANTEIWNFVSQFDINGRIGCATNLSIQSENTNDEILSIFPNPFEDQINVRRNSNSILAYSIYSTEGKLVQSGTLASSDEQIIIPNLEPNIYILKIGNSTKRIIKF